MPDHPSLRRRLLVTACAATRTTELVARRTGVARFLPALFPLRYANMGGLDRETFAEQLRALHSFADEAWCGYWDAIAAGHLGRAQRHVDGLAGGEAPRLAAALDDGPDAGAVGAALAELLAVGTRVLADHGPQSDPAEIERLAIQEAARAGVDVARVVDAAMALDEIVKAVTLFQVAAFPGTSRRRMASYWRSRRLFDAVVPAFAEGLGLTIEPLRVEAGGETVGGVIVVPAGDVPRPAVLVTNGLEGTFQELVIPLMRHRDSGLAVVAMEMPGTYAYRRPMTAASEEIYDRVLEQVAADPRIDARRIGMVGVSFGGYWSTRLAAGSSVLRAAVSCGAPTHHSFGLSLGMPEIILHAMAEVVGAANPIALLRAVRRLDLADRYAEIEIPLLVINGDHDTLLSTQDSIDLAGGAPRGELKLYPGDDHCAMGHYHAWLELSQRWLVEQLGAEPSVVPAASTP